MNLRRPLLRHSIVGVVCSVAFTAVTGFPAAPGDPEVNETTVAIRDDALAGGATLAVDVDGGPELIAFTWAAATAATFELRALDGDGWSDWLTLDGEPNEGPDTSSAEWTPTGYAGPAFLGRDISDVEVRTTAGDPHGLVLHAIDSEPVEIGDGVASAATQPPLVITRAQWGADESWRDDSGGECDGEPAYSDDIQMATVHHTVNANDYTQAESAAIIRGIYDFHVHGNGWCDIGYQFLVDRFGQIFEGRYGGITRSPIGGHASGFNTVSTGVAMIGDYTETPVPPSAYSALVDVLAFKLAHHGVDPLGTSTVTVGSNSSARWPEGTRVTLPNIEGHRDSNNTSCPGAMLYALLPQLRTDVANEISEQGLQPVFTLGRIAASDRFATAASIARSTFPSASTAFLARGDGTTGFADTLAANYLAGLVGAPVLLSATDHVPASTLDALDGLGVETLHLLGGPAAIGTEVETALVDRGLTTTRVEGADRFETAANIARVPGTGAVGLDGGRKTAILSSGRSFADALAAGGIVYGRHFPQLLTEPNLLPSATSNALRDLGIQHVIITGGPSAVSSVVELQLGALGISTERVAGATRYDTALALANLSIGRYGYSPATIDIATGESFPDALAGGSHAGTNGSPLILTPNATPSGSTTPAVCNFLQANGAAITRGTILGGRSAVKSGTKYHMEECIQAG